MKLLNDFYILIRFIFNHAGRQYDITSFQKFLVAVKIIRNTLKIPSLTTWQTHLFMVENILRIPQTTFGDIVECGCFKGASTANLSLAAKMSGRTLYVCDSFEGLPEPSEKEKTDINVYSDKTTGIDIAWMKGDYAGSLEEVKENVKKYGAIKKCIFVKGYYSDTLPVLDTKQIAFVFEDADIVSSVVDCIKYLWPRLQENCLFLCHEPNLVPVVSLFFSSEWWEINMNARPPGFFGSGRGVLYGFDYISIGYARKRTFTPQ